MKTSEFLRWLIAKGCTTGGQRGSHLKIYYRGRQSVIPAHRGKEMKTGTMMGILRQLGLKDEFRKGE